jgi:hypothetical protein
MRKSNRSPEKARSVLMRTTTDEEVLLRGGRVGQVAIFISLLMVFGGLIASFTEYKVLTILAIGLGVVMYTIGSRGQQQAAREPRLTRQLEQALAEFDDRYHLYNHVLPADHLLLTPDGAFALVLRGMGGKIRCFQDKWSRQLTIRRVLQLFTDEPLGNPSKEAEKDAEKLAKYIEEHAPQVSGEVRGVVIFTNPAAQLEITSAAVPILPLSRLKNYLRKAPGRAQMAPEALKTLTDLFDEAPES